MNSPILQDVCIIVIYNYNTKNCDIASSAEFTEAEARAVAKDIEQRAKSWRELEDGRLWEFATVTHRDGWKYHLLATVKRAPK